MSDVNWHALPGSADADDESYYGMPYIITVNHKEKKISVTVPGQWTGSTDQGGVSMRTNAAMLSGKTIISFHFSGAAGTVTSAPLTKIGNPAEGCTVEMRCVEE
jgi:hypothetical protein